MATDIVLALPAPLEDIRIPCPPQPSEMLPLDWLRRVHLALQPLLTFRVQNQDDCPDDQGVVAIVRDGERSACTLERPFGKGNSSLIKADSPDRGKWLFRIEVWAPHHDDQGPHGDGWALLDFYWNDFVGDGRRARDELVRLIDLLGEVSEEPCLNADFVAHARNSLRTA